MAQMNEGEPKASRVCLWNDSHGGDKATDMEAGIANEVQAAGIDNGTSGCRKQEMAPEEHKLFGGQVAARLGGG